MAIEPSRFAEVWIKSEPTEEKDEAQHLEDLEEGSTPELLQWEREAVKKELEHDITIEEHGIQVEDGNKLTLENNHEGFGSEARGRSAGQEVQKKWKHLRQNYRRELQARKLKSGSENKKRSPYVYFEMLSFLAPVFAHNQTATSVIEEDEVSSNLAGMSSAAIPESAPQMSANRGSKRKRETDDSVGEVCSLLKESLAVRRQMGEKRRSNEEEDEDKQFLLSLVSYMRKVKHVDKLAMRAELLKVVTKYYSRNVSPLNIN